MYVQVYQAIAKLVDERVSGILGLLDPIERYTCTLQPPYTYSVRAECILTNKIRFLAGCNDQEQIETSKLSLCFLRITAISVLEQFLCYLRVERRFLKQLH